MSDLTAYTSYVAVRGCLGVSDIEITDDVLSQPELVMQFEMDMNAVDDGGGVVLTQFQSILEIDESLRTVDQKQLVNVVRLLACYSVARQQLATAPMFAPLQITDGKASMTRADNPWERLSAGVLSRYNSLLKALIAVLGKLLPNLVISDAATPVTRDFILSIPIGTDPVTGS